jgi:hypothetical protein
MSCPDFFVPKISVADPHHVDADPDPNPSFQIKAQNLKKVLKKAHILYICHLQIDADPPDPDPYPAFHFDEDQDPNPTFQFDADPDPQYCLKYVNYLGKCVNVLSQDFWDVWLSMDMGSDIMEGYIKWIR